MGAWAATSGADALQQGSRPTLRGATPIRVMVSDMPEAIAAMNLGFFTQSGLKAEIEQNLQTAGIRVFNDTSAALRVDVNALRLDTGGIAYAVEVGFYQDVSVVRNGERTWTRTWTTPAVLGVTADPKRIWAVIRERVNAFINDYLAENPMRPANG